MFKALTKDKEGHENTILFEHYTKENIYLTVYIEVANQKICEKCENQMKKWRENNSNYQSTFPIIKDAFNLLNKSIEKLLAKCVNKCTSSIKNYTLNVGKESKMLKFEESFSKNDVPFINNPIILKNETDLLLKEKESQLAELREKNNELLYQINSLREHFERSNEYIDNLKEKLDLCIRNNYKLNFDLNSSRESYMNIKTQKENLYIFCKRLREKLYKQEILIRKLKEDNFNLNKRKIENDLSRLETKNDIGNNSILVTENENDSEFGENSISGSVKGKILLSHPIRKLAKNGIFSKFNNVSFSSNNLITDNTTGSSDKLSNTKVRKQKSFDLKEFQEIESKFQNVNNIKKNETFYNESAVLCLVVFEFEKLKFVACGGADSTIKIFEILYKSKETETSSKILFGHKSFITSINHFDNNNIPYLISGSADSSIIIWNIFVNDSEHNEFEIIYQLNGHEGIVNCILPLEINQSNIILASGGIDSTIRLWDLNQQTNEKCYSILYAHNLKVTCLAKAKYQEKNVLISGSFDGTLKIWDYLASDNNQFVMSLDEEYGKIDCIGICNINNTVFIAIANDDFNIILIHLDNEIFRITLKGHTDTITSIDFGIIGYLNVFISSSRDATVRFWDPIKQSLLLTLSDHKEQISCLASYTFYNENTGSNYLSILTGSIDQTVICWY